MSFEGAAQREAAVDDGDGIGTDTDGLELVSLRPANIGRVVARSRTPHACDEVFVNGVADPFALDFDDTERRHDMSVDRGLFAEFADGRRFGRFPLFDAPARKRPFSGGGGMPALHQEHAPHRVEHDHARRHDAPRFGLL
jgi:hypothetical protein